MFEEELENFKSFLTYLTEEEKTVLKEWLLDAFNTMKNTGEVSYHKTDDMGQLEIESYGEFSIDVNKPNIILTFCFDFELDRTDAVIPFTGKAFSVI
jgi:hypothetical protein